MIQRDLKIGLALGLVIVAGVIIKLAIDPRLSTEARMMSRIDSNDNLGSIDFNNTSQNNFASEVTLDSRTDNQSEQSEDIPSEENIIEIAKQNNDEITPFPALQNISEHTPLPIQIPAELQGTSNNNIEVIEKPERFHIVEKNQTLSAISRIYYGSPNQWQKIVDANPALVTNPNKIKPGMKLVIP